MSNNQLFLRFGILGFVCGVMLVVGGVWGCGSSSSTATDDGTTTGDTVTLTGTILAPAVSASISARDGPSFEITDVLVGEGITVSAYTLDGILLGTAPTDAGGGYSIEALSTDLPVDTIANIIISADNGIELVELNVTVGLENAFDAANTDSTLVAEALRNQIPGCIWGGDCASALAFDASCFMYASSAMFEASFLSLGEDNIGGSVGMYPAMIESFMAAGGSPADVGYTDWPSLMSGVFDGTFADSVYFNDFVAAAAIANDAVAGFEAADLTLAYGGLSAVTNTLESLVTTGGLAVTSLNLYPRGVDLLKEGDATSVCGAIEGGDIDALTFVEPFLAVDDVDNFTQIFGDIDGLTVYVGYTESCMDEGCSNMMANPAAVPGFMVAFNGDYTGIYDPTNGEFNTTALEGFNMVVGSCGDASYECATAMHNVVYTAAGGWENVMVDGAFDTTVMEAMASYVAVQISGGFDVTGAASTYWSSLWNGGLSTFVSDPTAATTVMGCLNTQAVASESRVDYTEGYTACYTDLGINTNPGSFEGWYGETPPTGDFCGDLVCAATETEQTCAMDCGDYTMPEGYGYCGDGTCDAIENSLSCPLDCTDESAPVCGNFLCEMEHGETNMSCPADCSASPAVCGNFICEMPQGETPVSCPADCMGGP